METLENNLNENPNNNNAVLKLGIISGLILVLISFVLFFTDTTYKPEAGWLSTFVMFCLIVFSQKILTSDFYKITFGKIFSYGFKITLIISIFSSVYIILYTNVINTEYAKDSIAFAKKKLAEQHLSEEVIEDKLEKGNWMFNSKLFLTIFMFFKELTLGSLFSVIGAAVLKKE